MHQHLKDYIVVKVEKKLKLKELQVFAMYK